MALILNGCCTSGPNNHTPSSISGKTVGDFDMSLDTDGNGLPDWWEMHFLGHLGNDPNSRPEGGGLTLLEDYELSIDPHNYYRQNGNIIAPTLTVLSGNNQNGIESTLTPLPLCVLVTNCIGTPLEGAPVEFTVKKGRGFIALSTNSQEGTVIRAFTEANGRAQVYYFQPKGANSTSQIDASAESQLVTFTETTEVEDGSLAAPTGIMATPNGPSEMDITWINHATNADYILLQQSDDDEHWTTTAIIKDPKTTFYGVKGLQPGENYRFRVAAGKN